MLASSSDRHAALAQNFQQIVSAITICAGGRLITPALILLYCGIDIAAWLYVRQDSTPVGRRFIEWTSKYLLPGSPLKCRAVDLYGARCGLVHTFSAESDLSAAGKARKVLYAWGNSKVDTLAEASSLGDMSRSYVAVQFEDLVAAFARGVDRFLADIEKNPARARRACERAERFFTTLGDGEVENLVRNARELLGDDLYRRSLKRP